MKRAIFIAAAVLMLCFFNFAVLDKEQLRHNGSTALLELAPADPRSLMQGDYMRLNYKVARDLPREYDSAGERGYMVLTVGADGVAQYSRFDGGEPLKANEMRIRYHREYGYHIVPDSFMFQEGLRELYRPARYGVFKYDAEGHAILVGLAGPDKQLIDPKGTLPHL